jgi:hypothetical protein
MFSVHLMFAAAVVLQPIKVQSTLFPQRPVFVAAPLDAKYQVLPERVGDLLREILRPIRVTHPGGLSHSA